MTNPTNTNRNEAGAPTANQGKQGDPAKWNTQKTGQTGQKEPAKQSKGGAHVGGKNPPTGGPDEFRPEKPMEGQARDPYPPTNPERPVMGGAQGNVQGQKGGQIPGQAKGSSFGGNAGRGSIPSASGTLATPGTPGSGNVAPGLEEEE